MKKISCIIGLLLIYFSSSSQLTVSFEKDTLTFERDKNIDQVIHLSVSIKNINPLGGVPNTISFAINPLPATTMAFSDYSLTTTPITVSAGIKEIDCPITIMHGENASETSYISVQLSYNNPVTQQKNIVLKITNKEEKKDEDKSKKKNSLEIGALSVGHSFDFFGKDNSLISYADIFIFNPNAFSIGKNPKEEKYGFALKLFQNKSVTVDSLNTSGTVYKFINQTLVSPFQPPVDDSVFLKQEVLTRKSSYKSNNWGMYLRVFRDISYTNKKTKFYLGLHGEFLRRDIETTYEYKSEKDTIIKVRASKVPYPNNTPLSKKSNQSEFYIAPFIQFLYGTEDINAHFSLIPVGLNIYRYTAANNTTTHKLFFLGQFDLTINKISLKLGAECRGHYNMRTQPYWNVFISKSFTWEKLKDLFFE